jgi:hypothetical protein
LSIRVEDRAKIARKVLEAGLELFFDGAWC